jgi:hypothetical protein
MIEDFFHLPPVSTTPVVHLELRISPQIFLKKFETTLLVYSGAWGKLIHEKTRSTRDTVPLSLQIQIHTGSRKMGGGGGGAISHGKGGGEGDPNH